MNAFANYQVINTIAAWSHREGRKTSEPHIGVLVGVPGNPFQASGHGFSGPWRSMHNCALNLVLF